MAPIPTAGNVLPLYAAQIKVITVEVEFMNGNYKLGMSVIYV